MSAVGVLTVQGFFQGFVFYSHITRKEDAQWQDESMQRLPQTIPFVYLKG
jgi:hypothetical protein